MNIIIKLIHLFKKNFKNDFKPYFNEKFYISKKLNDLLK